MLYPSFDTDNEGIYCITHKSDDIQDIYIGKTVDLRTRIRRHKYDSKQTRYNKTKLYNFVKENGGWDMFDIELLRPYKYDQNNPYYDRELGNLEHNYIANYKPHLNSKSVSLYDENNKCISTVYPDSFYVHFDV